MSDKELELSTKQGDTNRTSRIERADRVSSSLLLSLAQESLWFLDQLDHAVDAAYHLFAAYRLEGSLDRASLRRAFDEVVARHESFRTCFVLQNGVPVQSICPASEANFELIERDLTDLPESLRDSRVNEISRMESSKPFNLSTGPLMRAQLLCLAEHDQVLLLTQHHIISDGWSAGVFLAEMSKLYNAFVNGRPNPLPLLRIQYADYALWQRRWLRPEILQRQLDFWIRELSGAPSLLQLPIDRPRPSVPGYVGKEVYILLSPTLTAGLKELSRRHSATLFVTLLAGWSVQLSRLSGQEDLVIGTVVANRPRKELWPLIGLFINTLSLRVRLDGDPNVVELLARTKKSVSQAYEHQDVPFAHVVKALQPRRNLSYNPVFQVLLTFDNAPGARAPQFEKIKVSPLDSAQGGAAFDLLLTLRETEKGIEGALEFADELFDRTTVERMVEQLIVIFEGMVADEQRSVRALPLLSRLARQQLIVDFNRTKPLAANHRPIHELFQRRVEISPDAIALVYSTKSLTYRELNCRANQIANYLLALGVRPDDIVAICIERSLEMVVGLLGILKAGAAYLPLDSQYPAHRIANILGESKPFALLVADATTIDLALPSVRSIDISTPTADWSHCSKDNPDSQRLGLAPHHLAYVLYTSGSTGEPKGVMVEQSGIVNLLSWYLQELPLSKDDAVLVLTSYCFDLTQKNLLGPLLAGGQVHLGGALFDAESALRQMANDGITVVNLTPSMLSALIYADTAGSLSKVRRIVLGGEPVLPQLLQKIDGVKPEFINSYGPTECTDVATYHRLSGDLDRYPHNSVPLGKPLPNVAIYILDRYFEPVPIGVVGEIYIGGAGVSRGYLNREDLTLQRFFADPFSSNLVGRMYATGDLGRWKADGNVEYIGRNDFQVKIRGYRIELGEIESQMRRHPLVEDAVVLAREDETGNTRLFAYYIPAIGNEDPSPQVVRQHLLSNLPDFMIPSSFVCLHDFPLTPNGKLDREALPSTQQSAMASAEFQEPVEETEALIAQIWQTLLGVRRVGRHDNFFDLGGHSLLIVRFLEMLKTELRRPIGIYAVYKAPTPAGLAALIQADQPFKHLVQLNGAGFRSPLYCLAVAEGDTSTYLYFAKFVDPSIPVYGLDAGYTGPDDLMNGTLDRLTESYEQEIRRVQPVGPYRLCGYSFGGSSAFELATRLESAGEEVTLILVDAYPISRTLRAFTWILRIIRSFQERRVTESITRNFGKFLVYENHRWLTGKDKDLTHAMMRRAVNRKYSQFNGRVVLFKATSKDQRFNRLRFYSRNGWSKYAKGRFDVVLVRGAHLALMQEPAVHGLIPKLNEILCN